jgi:16S rRNA (guanine1516-N2)-methyltransferase
MGKIKDEDTVKGSATLTVCVGAGADMEKAAALAEKLGVQMIEGVSEAKDGSLRLVWDAEGLALSDGKLSMKGDFSKMWSRVRPEKLPHEMLVKAAKLKNAGLHPLAVDATAGLGEDSMILAAAGFSVQLYEYNPVIAALLRDALERAGAVPELSEIVSRMELVEGDSLQALRACTNSPDLIYLDPMFPARQKSALIKKKFQLLQQLEQPCTDEEELVRAAIGAHPRKVVIKRPAKGAYLAGLKPDYSLEGKAIRYDCFVFART